MPEECKPEYWFLDLLDQPVITLRESGKKTMIAQQRLLPGRIKAWSDCASTVWNLPPLVESVVKKPYTSNNLVTPLVDGRAYMGDLFQRLRDLKQFEFALLAGWEFKSDQPLDHHDKLNTKVLAQLTRVISNK